ncbi:MAG: hypothetical protein IT308_10275, partial [Anaerolineaceae bacterium]|nr:hypothetical protein [Anaerolineaceae bacterium]
NFVMIRSHLLDSFAVIIYSFPAHYLGITDYLLIPAYAFIPRFIWPDKPIDISKDFARDYFNSNGLTAFAISTPADLYQHGGFIAVLFGLLIFGFLYRLSHEYLIRKNISKPLADRLPGLLFYIIVFVQFYLVYETALISGMTEFLKQLFFTSLLALFMQTRIISIGRKFENAATSGK